MSLQPHIFNNVSGFKADILDKTQTNIQNTRFGTYSVSNYFSNQSSDAQVRFASQHPGFVASNLGISSSVIDVESKLLNPTVEERSLESLQLFPRPFLTVPYLGKGGGDPTLESQLQQGAMIRNLKSISTVSENTYIDYSQYPIHSKLLAKMNDPANSVEEAALSGWVRGGASSRE
jgi:hypothetical protein